MFQGSPGRMQEGKTLGFEIGYLCTDRLTYRLSILALARRKWRQRGQRPGGPRRRRFTTLGLKVPGPPLRKCGHLRVTLSSSESCSGMALGKGSPAPPACAFPAPSATAAGRARARARVPRAVIWQPRQVGSRCPGPVLVPVGDGD